MRYYTIWQIHKRGLIKTTTGKPYKDKASVSRLLRAYAYRRVETPHGAAKCFSEEVIAKINAANAKLGGR